VNLNHLSVLGVSASPERGATQVLVRAALLGAGAEGAATTFADLRGKRITPCNGCGPCIERSRCVIDDDMESLYPALLASDVVILGTPVYFGSPTALCKAFMERVEGFGIEEKKLRFKIGGAIAVAASDHGGQESTMAALHLWFQINEMLPVGITTSGAGWGVGARAPTTPEILTQTVRSTTDERRIRVVEAAWLYGRKLARVAGIVQAGLATSGLDLPDRPYGQGLPATFPPELAELEL
jgi:multimeric flavodoxin WrbA